jgi:Mg2+/Co2+ transporter CorC
MKPMGLISTPFITFRDIKVKDIDLIEDAWGLNSEFYDVIDLLRQVNPVPEKCLTTNLIKKFRKKV